MADGTTSNVFQKLVLAARESAARKNYDLAIMYYQQVLSVEQNAVEIRRELRAAALRNAKEKNVPRWTNLLQEVITRVKLPLTKSPEAKMNLCEQCLARDPENAKVQLLLAQAAQQANYPETAIAVLEDLRALKPQFVPALRQLLALYHDRQEIDPAMLVAQAILDVLPHDFTASDAMRDLSAEKAAQPYAAAKSARGMVRSSDETRERDLRARSEHDIHDQDEASERIAFLTRRIQETPEEPKNWLALGDLYRQLEQWPAAQTAYAKARELNPIEYTYVMRLEDLELARLGAAVRELDRRRRGGEGTVARELAEQQRQLAAYRLDSFVRRERQYPTDLKIGFDLGRAYFELGKWDEAIRRFQRTQYDPENRDESRLHLGQAFQQKGEHELALRTFSEALSNLETLMMNETRKALLYARAEALESLGRLPEALADDLAIYEKDIAFRDIQERVRRLRQKMAAAQSSPAGRPAG